MNKTLVTALFIGFLCSHSFSQENTVVKGKMKKARGTMVYLNHNKGNKMVKVDSSKVNFFGNFQLSTPVEIDDFFSLSTVENNKETQLLILKKEEKIKIKTSKDFKDKNYQVSGSKDNELIQQYYSVKSSEITKDSMSKYAFNFVKDNSKSLVVFVALNDIIEPKEAISIAAKGIGESYPNTLYHSSLLTAQKQIAQAEKAKQNKPKPKTPIGSVAPEVNMPSPDGTFITLESLRGKYVLIDFWASWCGPCRRENPNVVNLYNKYKDQEFEVYSVSLDKSKAAWEGAIKKDNLTWKSHVSDLKGWGSAATQIYGFRGIPFTVLIDKEGKVIGTRLRGPALASKLKEIFGN